MAEYIIQENSLTAIADEIRELSGFSGSMSLRDMTMNLQEANDVVEEQANLISQIRATLKEKTSAPPSFEEQMIAGNLTEYTNSSIEQIGDYVLYKREGLTSVSFPACTTIGIGAFARCTSLTSVSFPVCTSIGNSAFLGCKSLTSISFPACTIIGNSAFEYCSSLTTVSFPVCNNIGSFAFYSCTDLTSVSFPTCTTIYNSAFAYCSSLSVINFPSCTYIGSNAFGNCVNLTMASLPACTSISQHAFYYCYNLKSLYLTGSSVCNLLNSNVFSYTPIGGNSASAGTYGSIYVPVSLLTSYQSATNWSYYSSRFVGI